LPATIAAAVLAARLVSISGEFAGAADGLAPADFPADGFAPPAVVAGLPPVLAAGAADFFAAAGAVDGCADDFFASCGTADAAADSLFFFAMTIASFQFRPRL
jgi:hypothetical protein